MLCASINDISLTRRKVQKMVAEPDDDFLAINGQMMTEDVIFKWHVTNWCHLYCKMSQETDDDTRMAWVSATPHSMNQPRTMLGIFYAHHCPLIRNCSSDEMSPYPQIEVPLPLRRALTTGSMMAYKLNILVPFCAVLCCDCTRNL